MITIRRAVYEDIPRIMEFIDIYWKKDHILARDRKLFEWQHVRNGEVFYILGEDIEDGQIYGSVGYIPMSYDLSNRYISTVMVCTKKNREFSNLSFELDNYCENMPGVQDVIGIGFEKRYAKALQILTPDCMGELQQYYRLRDLDKYYVAKIENKIIIPANEQGSYITSSCIHEIFEWLDRDSLQNRVPYESEEYLKHRYEEHPYYQYEVLRIGNEQYKGAVIGRFIAVNGHIVFRIVDYLGDDQALCGFGTAIDRFMEDHNCEYTDIYCHGISGEIMSKAGFTLRKRDDTNIIPNYFEPYELKNVDLDFHSFHKSSAHIYRGMSDQDRPNYIK
ncbi:MAG: hypothetical protein IJ079_02070 [Lachnospiraceae bacterium]|nr:hypothetical protein [Lachnospiraceae bacterium]